MRPVLDGIRVLDFSRYVAGPFCGAILADMGAEVIRVENVGGAEDRNQGPMTPSGLNMRYLMLGRNKKGITLDLENPRGRELFLRLLEKTDVIVENFSPPVKEKLGLTYEALCQTKADIILADISAFGTTGPERDRLGFDQTAQAESGAMSMTGFPDGPPVRDGVTWVDLTTAVHSALGVALALLHRNRTGEGQWVETALLDTAVACMGFTGVGAEFQVLGLPRPQLGNYGYFYYCNTLKARDGSVMVAATSNPLWRRLARLIGRPDLIDDPRFADDTTRYQNKHLIDEAVQEWVGNLTVEESIAAMESARVPCGRVNSIAQVMAHPQVLAREVFQKLPVDGLGEVVHPRVAIRMSRTPGKIETAAPTVGQHNQEIFCGLLGLCEAELESLQADGII